MEIMTTIPFNPPQLLTARRKAGFVDIPEAAGDESLGWDGNRSTAALTVVPEPPTKMAGPTFLRRASTMAGNILIFEQDEKPPQAFWIQRKIGKSSSGIIRLGYKLRPNSNPEFKESTEAWELALDEDSGDQKIVTISMMHSSVLDMNKSNASEGLYNPLDELSALQMIARQHESSEHAHVVSTDLIATCAQHLYAILPYHPDGTLLQYCQTMGSLDEPLARFFFRQILQGLKTLQDTGLCHRNLSLDAIALNGDIVDIARLGWSLRYNKNAPKDSDRALPAPGGNNPQYIAPEYFGNLTGVWDGFSADLWACGLMLYSMVVSVDSEALFVAPIPEDPRFVELCIKGCVESKVSKFGKKIGQDIKLSEDLVDLLKQMLKADPKQRLSLDEVMEHRWVKDGESIPPSVYAEKQNKEDAPQTPPLQDEKSEGKAASEIEAKEEK